MLRTVARPLDTPSDINEEIEEDIESLAVEDQHRNDGKKSPENLTPSPDIHDKSDNEKKEEASPVPEDDNDNTADKLSIASSHSSNEFNFDDLSDLSLGEGKSSKDKV